MEVYNYEDAVNELKNGFAIQATTWGDLEFVYLDSDEKMRDENDELFDLCPVEYGNTDFYLVEIGDECEQKQISEDKSATGTQEHGDHGKVFKSEKNTKEKEIDLQSTRPKELEKDEKSTKEILNKEEREALEQKKNIGPTSTKKMNAESNGQETIGKNKMNTKESTTEKTDQTNLEKSSEIEKNEIPSLASSQILTELKMENSGSIQLLDDSARQLHEFASQLAMPPRIDEQTGEVIQRAPSSQVMEAVKCLDACRNMMKVKLDYLKFGKNLVQELK